MSATMTGDVKGKEPAAPVAPKQDASNPDKNPPVEKLQPVALADDVLASIPDNKPVAAATQQQVQDSTVLGDVNVGNTNNTTYINVAVNSEDNEALIRSGERFAYRKFSVGNAEEISLAFEADNAEKYVGDERTTQALLAQLRSWRLLVLCGRADSGKGATSLMLANALREADIGIRHNILRVRSLEAEVRVDLAAVARASDFGGRVLVLQNALARDNRDLCSFIKLVDEAQLDRIRRDLEANHAYVILTVDVHALTDLSPSRAVSDLCCMLPDLTPEKLREGLDRALREARHGVAASQPASSLSEQQIDEIVARAHSMPRLLRLVRDYLPQIERGELQVREVIDRIDNTSIWFQRDLSADPDAWCFAFVLTLASAVKPAEGVGWVEFEHLRKALLPAIGARLGIPTEHESYQAGRITEDALLNKTYSCIERDSSLQRDILRFRDASYAGHLWTSILAHNRGLLIELVQVLKGLAEDARDADNLRICAAQVLGRIGEIDPHALVLPLARSFAVAESMARRAMLGHLFQGALFSCNGGYRDLCLAELDRMAAAKLDSERGEKELWSAIAAYKRVGIVELPLALRKLAQIVDRRLGESIGNLRGMQKQLREIEFDLSKHWSRDEDETEALMRHAHELIQAWSNEIFKTQLPVLFAVQYAVVALCYTHDPVLMFAELRRWMNGSEILSAVTVMIYLRPAGVGDEMSRCSEPVPPGTQGAGDEPVLVSPLVLSLMTDAKGARPVAQCLEDVFVGIGNPFPVPVAQYLRQAFFSHLTLMVEQAAVCEQGLHALEDVFVYLLNSPVDELNGKLTRIFVRFGAKSAPLGPFAANVLRRARNRSPLPQLPPNPFDSPNMTLNRPLP